MFADARERALGKKPEIQRFARPQVLLAGGLVCGAAGLAAFALFVQAEFFTVQDHSQWTYVRGYSPAQLFALIAYLILAPAAVAAVLCGFLNVLQTRRSRKAIVTAAVVVLALALAAVGWAAGRDLLRCGFLFCADAPAAAADPSGFVGTTGAAVFTLSVAVAAATIAMYFASEKQPTLPAPDLALVRLQRRRRGCAVLVLLILPLLVVVCGLLPSQWNKMTLNLRTLQKFAKARRGIGSSEIAPCTGAELYCGDAIFVTQNFDIGAYVVKLQPDVLLFYGTIEALLLLAVAEAEIPLLRRACARRLGKTTVGDIVKLTLLAVFYCGFLTYWLHDHLYEGGKFHQRTEVIARSFGTTAAATLGFLLLPAAKSSVLLQAAGVSWESTVVIHIALGVLFLVISFAHVATFFVRFCQLGYPTDVLPFNFGGFWYPINTPTMPMDDFTVPAMATVYWPALIIFGWLPWRRRLNWEQFKYAHHFFLVLVPMVIVHATSSWYYVLPGAALWLADRAARFFRAAETVRVTDAIAHVAEDPSGVTELVTELRVTWSGHEREHSPGMYCFVNCPQIAAAEWHPFSISSSPHDREATFHIKGMDSTRHTWTGKLHSLVQSLAAPQDLVLHIDGPYGPPLSHSAPRLVLVAGGIGITPMQSTFRYLLQRADRTDGSADLQRLHLVWAARSPSIFDVFADSLDLSALPRSISTAVSLYCNLRSSQGKCRLGEVAPGVPAFDELLRQELSLGECCVRVCGPPPMVAALTRAVEALPPTSRKMLDYQVWSFVL
jgi:predicted ferric reductase